MGVKFETWIYLQSEKLLLNIFIQIKKPIIRLSSEAIDQQI